MTIGAVAMSANLAPFDGLRVLTSWRLDVPALIVIALLGSTYLFGVARLRRRGQRWPVWPVLAFTVLGLGSIAVLTMSSLGVYGQVLFWPRAVQNVSLLSVTPLLLALGEPLQLARLCLSDPSQRRLTVVLSSRAARIVCFPLVGAASGCVALLVLYLTPLYGVTLANDGIAHVVRLALFLIGCLFYIPQLDSGDELWPAWCGYPARVAFSFVDGLLDAVPGVVIMTSSSTIAAGHYTALQRPWGPSPHWDQTIGGGLMFTFAEVVALPFLAVLFVRWIREDERQAREMDRRLDHPADAGFPADDDRARSTRPWWETDPGPLADRQIPGHRRGVDP